MRRIRIGPYGSALLAAALFGAGFPLSKTLLKDLQPLALAGLLYLASGLGLGLIRFFIRRSRPEGEASLKKSDLGWLLGVIVAGGVAGPVLLLFGLSRSSAHVSALLVNTETLFTVLLALLFFGDFLLRREVIGAVILFVGATLVAWAGPGTSGSSSWKGPLLLLGAGLAWGLDNNFSQRLSGKDPLQVGSLKGLIAGLVNLALAWATEGLPHVHAKTIAFAMIVGLLSYGLSIVLFMTALRHLGAARTSSLFATAPAMAIVLSWAFLGEVPGALTLAGAGLMIPGAWLLIRSGHAHRHEHEAIEHEHRHTHDEHHRHDHQGGEGSEPHSHRHRHENLVHDHPHAADLHHRHFHT